MKIKQMTPITELNTRILKTDKDCGKCIIEHDDHECEQDRGCKCISCNLCRECGEKPNECEYGSMNSDDDDEALHKKMFPIKLKILIDVVKLTIEKGLSFDAVFSRQHDECIKNSHGVMMKKLSIHKHHCASGYVGSVSCYNGESNDCDDDDFEDDNECSGDPSFVYRHPIMKGRYHIDNNNLETIVKKVSEAFNSFKICQSCEKIHTDFTPNKCNNCILLDVFNTNYITKMCVICQEETDRYYTLPCNHILHNKCASLLPIKKCPLCRKEFTYELNKL